MMLATMMTKVKRLRGYTDQANFLQAVGQAVGKAKPAEHDHCAHEECGCLRQVFAFNGMLVIMIDGGSGKDYINAVEPSKVLWAGHAKARLVRSTFGGML